jgi:hypothetical protein
MKFEFIILLSSLAGLKNVSCEKFWFIIDHVHMNVFACQGDYSRDVTAETLKTYVKLHFTADSLH